MSIRPETAKRLRDARRACVELQTFSAGKTRHDLETERAFQLVVERLLEIVGEALRHAERHDPSIGQHIPNIRSVIGTRNRLSHGYDDVDYVLLWDIVKVYGPALIIGIDELLLDKGGNA